MYYVTCKSCDNNYNYTYDVLCMYISELQVTTNYLVHNVILYIIYYLIRAILS